MTFRTRTKGNLAIVPGTYVETRFNGTIASSTAVDNVHLTRGELQTTTDVVTPGYRRKSKSGEIVNNPFRSTKIKRGNSYSGFHWERKSGTSTTVKSGVGTGYCYAFPNFGSLPNIDISSLKTIAGTEAAARVLKPELDGLVEVAEFRKTMELFHVRRGALDRHLDRLLAFASRKGKLRKGARFFANNWLKYRYGIMPLVHTLDKVLHMGEEPKPLRLTARGLATDEESILKTVSNNTGLFWNCSWDVHMNSKVTVRAGVLYEILRSHNRYGFNFSDLPAAAWELVPYSFVVDWFSNVGDFIASVTPKVGARKLATWTSVQRVDTVTGTLTSTWKASDSTYTEIQAPEGTVWSVSDTKTRDPGISRGLAFDWASTKAIPTDKRIIDAFALTFQKILR